MVDRDNYRNDQLICLIDSDQIPASPQPLSQMSSFISSLSTQTTDTVLQVVKNYKLHIDVDDKGH